MYKQYDLIKMRMRTWIQDAIKNIFSNKEKELSFINNKVSKVTGKIFISYSRIPQYKAN